MRWGSLIGSGSRGRPLCFLLLAIALTLTACSGGGSEGNAEPPPFPEVPDATYGTSGGVTFVSYPSTDCTNVTATPVIAGEWLIFPSHEHRNNCSGNSAYERVLFGFHLNEGRLYILNDEGAGEAPLVYRAKGDRLYWNTTFGATVFVLDAQTLELNPGKLSVGATSDSAGVFLGDLYYFGTVNAPDSSCQEPINDSCGALFAIDGSNALVHRLDMTQDFRAWIGTSLTTDGESIFVGSAAPTLGEKGVEDRYLYGCSVTKVDRNLNILASFDPGDPSCFYLPYQGANADSVSGEVVPDGEGLWVQYVRPNEPSPAGNGTFESFLYRLDLSLREQCRVGFPFEPQFQAAGFYAAPTVDAAGRAFVPVTVPDGQGGSYGELYRVDRTCRAVRLDRVAASFAHASATLADDASVLFATDGRLRQLDLEGRLIREVLLASPARVLTSPVIHGGTVYVLQEDGTLNIIEDLGVSGYGTALWPRYRHDNAGSGALGGGGG